MSNRTVSIVTPCYNGEKYITRLLDSILAQNYSPLEIIVVDDGSTDSTPDILRTYEKRFSEKNTAYHIVKKLNGGVASAINAGLKKITGEFVIFIDADDFLNPGSIRKRVELLDANKHLDAVFSGANVVREGENDIVETLAPADRESSNLFMNMLLDRGYIWTPIYMIRRSYLNRVHPTMQIAEFSAGQNIQLFLPIWHKAVVGYIDEPLTTIVSHADSHSRVMRSERDTRHRYEEIKRIYIDTLSRMKLSKKERKEYTTIIDERFKAATERVFYDVIGNRDGLSHLYRRDEERFRGAYYKSPEDASQEQLASRMVFSAHSLEKSLSNDGFEIGHGFSTARLLVRLLDSYNQHGYDKSHLGYIDTISTLQQFYIRHRSTEYQKEIEDILNDRLTEIVGDTSDIGGAETVSLSAKKDNITKNFKELSEGRYAVRSYAKKAVNKNDIRDAVNIARKSPSVCNRQPIRVRVMYDQEIIRKVLEVQGGIDYYDTPPVLLLITADDRNYIEVNERNQGYIDGGLFAMSLLYALEYKGLAACPLHAMFETGRDFRIRGLLDIPDNEKLITFISAGHFKTTNVVCKSFRYPIEHILEEVEQLHDFRIETIHEQEPAHNIEQVSALEHSLDSARKAIRIRTRARDVAKKLGEYIDAREYRKADGAILTLTGYYNYGNVLQRYALQAFLQENGYNFISYADTHSAPRDIYRVGRKRQIKKPLRAAKRLLRGQKPYWYTPELKEIYPDANGLEHIIDFANNYIWMKPFDPRDSFPTYIVGSDQVWRNWWGDVRKLAYYFFDFLADKDVRRISYAASFGKDTLDGVMSGSDVAYVAPLLSKIDEISVREKSAAALLDKVWGIHNAETVIDPTLLLTAQHYSNLIDNNDLVKSTKTSQIFSYVIDETKEIADFIEKVAQANNQELTKIRAHIGAEGEILPHVETWLKGFRDADLAVTNSFHGVVFSIINKTDFIVIGREDGGLSRIENLLNSFGIVGRFIDEYDLKDTDISQLPKISWIEVEKRLTAMRASSGNWLLSALSSKKRNKG